MILMDQINGTASQPAVQQLSSEELELIVGGGFFKKIFKKVVRFITRTVLRNGVYVTYTEQV